MDRAHDAKKPFFVWFNSTRMHIFTHLKPVTGLGTYPDGMVEHDGQVGQLLKKLDDLGVADNTIVIYTTDNGAEAFSWPDGGMTPFRSEKNSNWEGGYRVPAVVRWPSVVKPEAEINGILSSEDWVPTLTAACGQPDIIGRLLTATTPTERRSRSTSTITTRVIFSPAAATSAGSSSTGPTTAILPVCATISGRWSSLSSNTRDCASGRNRLCRYSSIFAPIRSRRRRLNRGVGEMVRRAHVRDGVRAGDRGEGVAHPAGIPRARSPAASPSATLSTSCSTPRKAAIDESTVGRNRSPAGSRCVSRPPQRPRASPRVLIVQAWTVS